MPAAAGQRTETMLNPPDDKTALRRAAAGLARAAHSAEPPRPAVPGVRSPVARGRANRWPPSSTARAVHPTTATSPSSIDRSARVRGAKGQGRVFDLSPWNDADLFLRRKLSPGGAADLLRNLFRRFLHRPGSLSHLRSFNGYDGQKSSLPPTR